MLAEVVDLEERHMKTCAELDDETLVFCMFGILQPSMSGHHVAAGASATAGILARTVFMEIAARWIPAEVVGPALRQIMDGSEEEGDGG
jgi:hypothetical protein